jgi:hypothetical protein
LRYGACGQVFTAQDPEGVGPEKYDEMVVAMIVYLKYGSATPFYRLEQPEAQLGIPLPAATQREIVEEAAELIKPALDELIRQAAQGKVLHNDDTSMRVLKLKRPDKAACRGIADTDPNVRCTIATCLSCPAEWRSCWPTALRTAVDNS